MNTDINYILDNIKFNYHHRKKLDLCNILLSDF